MQNAASIVIDSRHARRSNGVRVVKALPQPD
jgi:hypothetical protein